MTNYERWMAMTSHLPSPDNYLQWCWWYTISSALQRRVWCGSSHQRLFPNMYIILVGRPGIGKGLAVREVSSLLKPLKLKDVIKPIDPNAMPVNGDKMSLEDLRMYKEALEKKNRANEALLEDDLFPVCPDATTYEALVMFLATCKRYIQYKDHNGKMQAYGHCTACFTLQELSSLLRRKTEDTVNLCLGLYDCPDEYDKITIGREKDRIVHGCLNILAACTPSFMQETFNSSLIDEGFTSRTFFIFANKNRKNVFWLPELTEEQIEHRAVLSEHLKKLSQVFGHLTIEPETQRYLDDWWNHTENNILTRANASPKLIPYYARKQIHVTKLAMARHFSESTSMTIPLECFQWAISFTAREEPNMSLALVLEGKNPESQCCRRILELLISGPKTGVYIMAEVHSILPDARKIDEQLEFLLTTGEIQRFDEPNPVTQKTQVKYRIPEKQ